MDPIRFLVLGGGINSAVGRVHRSALWLCEREIIILNGVFSREEDIQAESHRTWYAKDAVMHIDFKSLLHQYKASAKDVIVLVLLPSPDHFDAVMLALSLGYSVICEKPGCTSHEQALYIRDCIRSNNSFFRTTFNYCGYPMLREIRAMLESECLGELRQIRIEMPQEGLVRPPLVQGVKQAPQKWRLSDGSIPTVCLDLGVHLYHMLAYLTGNQFDPIFSQFSNHTSYSEILDTMNTLFISRNTALEGSMWITKSAIGYRNGLEVKVFGTEGSLAWKQTESERIEYAPQRGHTQIIERGADCVVAQQKRYERMKPGHPAGFIEAFSNLYMDIADEYYNWKYSLHCGADTDTHLLGIESVCNVMAFFEECSTYIRKSHNLEL